MTACSPPSILASTLAQATGASPSTAQTSTVVYWVAIALVAAGLGIFGVVIASALRGRRSAEADAIRAYSEDAQPAITAERSEPTPAAALVGAPRTLAPAAPSPTTMEAQNLLRLMGEAEELCTRLGRELDDKAERLERLLARAEGRLGAPLPAGPTVVAPPQPPAPAYVPRPEIVTRPMPVPAPALAAAPASAPSLYYAPPVAQTVPSAQPAPAAPSSPMRVPAAAAAADPYGIDPLTRDIYALADAGQTPAAIAQQLGQHTGKVELILALRGS